MVHTFKPSLYHTTIGGHEPVLEIADGDTVATSTVDARGSDSSGEQVTDPGNPQTGPFAVEDAAPGDVLAVRFDRLAPNRPRGWTSSRLAPFVVDAYRAASDFPPDTGTVEWIVDMGSRTARPAEPSEGLAGLVLPIDPMVGCFGVAPPGGQAINTGTSGSYGGNMDYRGFREGTTVYLPVFADGALFSLGDGHAVQGDGEIAGTGIEISFDVRFTVTLIKGREISWPRGEDATHVFTVGNARPLDEGLRIATTEMVCWLRESGMDERSVHLLMGQTVEYAVGNMFDPAYTMVCRMSKAVLSGIGVETGM